VTKLRAEEEFITTNCVEQGKDKWLCPLSGKKFKAPEFIHKHLHSKYQEQIDELKNEVSVSEFFDKLLKKKRRRCTSTTFSPIRIALATTLIRRHRRHKANNPHRRAPQPR
jgi:hypothetical protein